MIHNLQEGLFGLALLAGYGLLMHMGLRLMRRLVSRSVPKAQDTLARRLVRNLETPFFLAIMLVGLNILLSQVLLLNRYSPYLQLGSKLALILILSLALDRIVRTLIIWYAQSSTPNADVISEDRLMPLVRRLVSVVIWTLAGLAVLQQLDVQITPLLASLGVASLAVALALQDTLSNFFAGLYVIADRPLSVGDFIKLETGQEGTVDRVGWRSTRIRTPSNTIITVPNSKLAQSVLTNYSLPESDVSIFLPCGVAYGSDLDKVEQVTSEVVRDVLTTVHGGVNTDKSVVSYSAFGDSNIQFTVQLRVRAYADRTLIIHEFIKRLMDRYARDGIKIAFPTRSVYLRGDGKGIG